MSTFIADDLRTFSSLAVAIFIEAAPFLLAGSLIGALVEVFVSGELINRWVPRRLGPGILTGLFAGFILPTCECGVVPIVRRLLRKGVPPHVALTYLVVSPVFNPVVLASTYLAFRGDLRMLAGRVAMVALPAVALGIAFYGADPDRVLRESAPHDGSCGAHHEDEIHAPVGVRLAPSFVRSSAATRARHVLEHTASDFFEMGAFLLAGAFTAALFKTFVPPRLLLMLNSNVVLPVAVAMLLAMILSICSEVDAFVAASFTFFPAAAQLAFVSIGPVVDIKQVAMFRAVFRRRVIMVLVLIPVLLVFIISVMLGFALEQTAGMRI
jgi:hypothetical protein